AVLDNERLAEGFAQVLGQKACGDIGALARLVRHDDTHRLVGIARRHGGLAKGQRGQHECSKQSFHLCLLVDEVLLFWFVSYQRWWGSTPRARRRTMSSA